VMTTDWTLDAPPAAPPLDKPRLAESSAIVTIGHLMWLGCTWGVAALAYTVVIVCVSIWGEVDVSLWQSVFAGWQRFVVAAAGFTTITTFLRIFVRNGATRRMLSSASLAAMTVVSILGGALITAGWAIEKLVYDANGWTQTMNSDAVFDWSDLWRAAIESPIVLAAFFLSGWLISAAFYRFGVAGGIALLLPCAVPALFSELVTSKDFGGVDIDVLPEFGSTALAVTAISGLALIAVTAAVARRVTVAMALR
jgi:hypothetical protein